MFHIVLVEPEIPQNAGNIARTCAATGSVLHMVRPFGFEISDKYLKRAGLDYWNLVDIRYYDSFDEVRKENAGARFFFFTTKAKKRTVTKVSATGIFWCSEKRRKGCLKNYWWRTRKVACGFR